MDIANSLGGCLANVKHKLPRPKSTMMQVLDAYLKQVEKDVLFNQLTHGGIAIIRTLVKDIQNYLSPRDVSTLTASTSGGKSVCLSSAIPQETPGDIVRDIGTPKGKSQRN